MDFPYFCNTIYLIIALLCLFNGKAKVQQGLFSIIRNRKDRCSNFIYSILHACITVDLDPGVII